MEWGFDIGYIGDCVIDEIWGLCGEVMCCVDIDVVMMGNSQWFEYLYCGYGQAGVVDMGGVWLMDMDKRGRYGKVDMKGQIWQSRYASIDMYKQIQKNGYAKLDMMVWI